MHWRPHLTKQLVNRGRPSPRRMIHELATVLGPRGPRIWEIYHVPHPELVGGTSLGVRGRRGVQEGHAEVFDVVDTNAQCSSEHTSLVLATGVLQTSMTL